MSALKNASFQRWAMLITSSMLIALLLYPHPLIPSKAYKVGDVADQDIKATQDYLIEDEISTEKRRMEAMQKAMAVYDLDETALSTIRSRLDSSFSLMRDICEESPSKKTRDRLLWSKKEEFAELLGTPVNKSTFRTLVGGSFSPTVEEVIFRLIQPYLKIGVIEDKSLWDDKRDKGIIIRGIQAKKERVIKDLDSLWDVKGVGDDIKLKAQEFAEEVDAKTLDAALNLAQGMLLPNLTLNKKASEEEKIIARDEVKPVFFQIKKREMIVREGERIDENSLRKLAVQAQTHAYRNTLMMVLGSAFLVGILLCVAYQSARLHVKTFPSGSRDISFLCIMLISLYVTTHIYIFIAGGISRGFPYIFQTSVLYGIPVAVGAMLVSIFLGIHIAIIFSFVVSVCCALPMENGLQFFIYFFIGSLMAAHGAIHCRERKTLIKVGLLVGLVNVSVIIGIDMLTGTLFSTRAPVDMLFGFVGGLFIGIAGTGLCPLIEMAFGYISDIKLLELISVDQPLLKELMIQAPGTYHHSVLVSNLAEAGAEAINANPLLAKVSGYYHDIGKTKKPSYFVENQVGAESKHEKLAPSMSSLIIISHVRDGVALAKKYGLGQAIIDIINQHHGTKVMSFFYKKARMLKGSSNGSLKVENFRYPGPKPQTKEAGLVMLADAVEATARALVDPTPARIQGRVQKTINDTFSDGQLDDCELTLKDLHKIAKSFNKILNAIFHHRIEYPESPTKIAINKRKEDEDMDKRRPKQDKDKQEEYQKDSEQGLKRLGM